MKITTFIFLIVLACSITGFGQTDTKSRSEKAKPIYIEDKIDAEIAEITKALELEPNNSDLYLKRAYSYRLKHAAELVSSDVIKALSINPRDISVQLRAVRLLSDVERCEHALAIINTTIADNPKNDEAFDLRFRVKTCLGDTIGALDDVNKALSLNPQSSMYRTNQALTLQKLGESGKAAENFDQLVNLLEQKLKNAKEKEEKNWVQKEEIEKFKRELSMTYISRSRTFANSKNYEAMFADLNRAVEVNPMHYTYQTRAKAYKWRSMYAEAIADLTKAIELDNEAAGLLMDRGEVYFLMQKFPEAITDYEQVVKLNRGLEQIAEKRISSAKQKMQQNIAQPK